MSALTYRREIDGLRALAIVPVVLFHAGFDWLGGGYLGVDVFFVISGYLITSIILKEREGASFSLLRFWERRARRILPALFFMMVVCIPVAWLLLLPKEHWEFKESVGSVAVFLSNHLLLDQSGYFDTAADRKPLLHTWSLAVEEQFYLLFPLLLLGFWRLGWRFLFLVISLVVVFSLGFAEWLSREKPAAAFYLLPTRAWELGCGVLLAIINHHGPSFGNTKVRSTLIALVGLLLIVIPMWFYTPETRGPSLYTVVPVLGTCLVILAANKHNVIGRFLGLQLLVGVGLISYSLYLWHQPILAFARVQSFDNLTLVQKLSCIALAVIMAYVSWRWIERPFRDRSRVRGRALTLLVLSLSLMFIHIGIDGYQTKQAVRVTDRAEIILNEVPSIMLLGDSHASHLMPGLHKFLPGKVADFSRAGCIPFYGLDRYDSRGKPGVCPVVMGEALDRFVNDKNFDTLILSSMGPVYLTGEAFRGKDTARVRGMRLTYQPDESLTDRWKIYELAMRDTLTKLSGTKKNVIFVLDVPELGVEPLFCDIKGKSITVFDKTIKIRDPDNQQCFVPRAEHDIRTTKYRTLVESVLADYPTIIFVDPTDLFCDEVKCMGVINSEALYKDADHLSEYGSSLVAERVVSYRRQGKMK